MIKKILEPIKTYSNEFLMNLPIKEINGKKFRLLTRDERRRITSCQCFKDCECYDSIVGEIVFYYRSIENDGTDKAFYSLPKQQQKPQVNQLKPK